MAATEWGPRVEPNQNRRLHQVTSFSGILLQDISSKASYLQDYPLETRQEIARHLSNNGKDVERMEAALDVINQLAAVDRTASDINNVILLEGTINIVQKDPKKAKKRLDEGKPCRYYKIDWIREPDTKPVPPPPSPVQIKPPEPKPALSNPFTWVTGRPTRIDREILGMFDRAEEIERRKERERQKEEARREGEAIDMVIIDKGREVGEWSVNEGLVKIEINNDAAVILFRQDKWHEYKAVNRKTGEYRPSDKYPDEIHTMDRLCLRYFDILARQAEGEKVTYQPEQIGHAKCQDIYERAKKARMIIVGHDTQTGIIFEYRDLYHFNYAKMDLVRNVVNLNTNRQRPINPSFAAFLRAKKAELEKQTPVTT